MDDTYGLLGLLQQERISMIFQTWEMITALLINNIVSDRIAVSGIFPNITRITYNDFWQSYAKKGLW